jgi:hypothetical protein
VSREGKQFTSGTRGVTLVTTIPAISHEVGKDREVRTIINIKPMGNPQCQIKLKGKKNAAPSALQSFDLCEQ